MGTSRKARLAATAGFVVMVAVNVASVALPINGVTPDEVSNRYDTLFAPAGFTFSIWSVIYTFLIVYTGYQTFRSNRITQAVAWPFFATSLLNSAWIFAWHYDLIWLSVLLMIGLMLGLGRIVTILARNGVSIRGGIGSFLLTRAAFSLYFGWICVALVANISAFSVSMGWRGTGFSEEVWLVVTLVAASGIGLFTMFYNRDVIYGLVFVWAFWGILSRHRAPQPDGWANEFALAILAISVLLAVLAIGSVVALGRDLRSATSSKLQP